ncbi:Transcription factor [Coemansia javaensis]|uniref:Transcription factor n=1 Tax=Coemansia javaensis TaxID=2761396 RepID=A0A9W8LLT8_9FUNG|nr:Transcription factor [Coemansia javaensis]
MLDGDPDAESRQKGGAAARAKRQKVSKACVYCQRSHMACDDERPCRRCIGRNIAHMCRDKEGDAAETHRPAGTADGAAPIEAPAGPGALPSVATGLSSILGGGTAAPLYVGGGGGGSASGVPLGAMGPGPPSAGAGPSAGLLGADSSMLYAVAGAPYDRSALLSFGHDMASNEFSALNEFLEGLQRGVGSTESAESSGRQSNPPSGPSSVPPSICAVGSPVAEPAGLVALQATRSGPDGAVQQRGTMSVPTQLQQIRPQAQQPSLPPARAAQGGSLPVISQLMANRAGSDTSDSVTQSDLFVLTAADPNDGTSEDKLRQIINAKYEAGILKPYDYVKGYTRLQQFMDANLGRTSSARILYVLSTFRPTFRTIAQSLTDMDLLLIEEGFERLLLDYDNVFNSFGLPACLWRRTGEIYKANREFADLVGLPLSCFHEGRVCIYEIMSESSMVNYWEKYGEIAFDATQKAVLTSCMLQPSAAVRALAQQRAANGAGPAALPQVTRPVRCCFSFTLRRDKYNIPLGIIGNFIPR